jgi:GGDEF domain-containing protein
LGGDEFALVVLDGNRRAHLALMAEKLLAAVAEPIQLSHLGPLAPGSAPPAVRVSVRASLGIASFPADGGTPAVLLAAADRAMFHAKRAGLGFRFASDVDANAAVGPTSDSKA